jgi:nicotinamide mononucleotide transporter
MTWIEAIAVLFGLACVLLTIRQNIWCWPTGLVQVLLFIVIFYRVRLYSDLILHVIYVFMQIYGWYYWLHGSEARNRLPVTRMRPLILAGWILTAVAGTMLWGYLMARYTNAAAPLADAFTTVASLIAQWLMARKKLESWCFWISVDIVAIGIYLYKDLYLTTGLYAVFFVLATIGFFEWRKSYQDGPPAQNPAELAAS